MDLAGVRCRSLLFSAVHWHRGHGRSADTPGRTMDGGESLTNVSMLTFTTIPTYMAVRPDAQDLPGRNGMLAASSRTLIDASRGAINRD